VNFRNILAIESAIGDGSLSLLLNGDDGLVEISRSGASRAEKVLTEIGEILRAASISKNDLDLIAVSIGPGSYSGIRIGISTALGLSHALAIPLIGISTLEALACSVAAEKVIALVPIGKSDFAWQLFTADREGKKQAPADPALDSIATLSDSLSVHPDLPVVVPRYCFESIKHTEGEGREIIDAGSNLASAIAQMAFEKRENAPDLKPIYMRSAVAR